VIAKENFPGLQWPTLPRHHVDRNRGLRDIDGQFEQLAVDLGSAPQRVLNTHSSDQIEHLFADPWPANARAANGSVESGSSLSLRPMGLAPQPADLTVKSLSNSYDFSREKSYATALFPLRRPSQSTTSTTTRMAGSTMTVRLFTIA
jgi:hypothetical protein